VLAVAVRTGSSNRTLHKRIPRLLQTNAQKKSHFIYSRLLGPMHRRPLCTPVQLSTRFECIFFGLPLTPVCLGPQHQLIVLSRINDYTISDNQDSVRLQYRGRPMRNND
jgi:hypothetical protein